MKLSNIITDYRNQEQISQREFARRCGLSNSYISFIENEYNPRTGKPIVPTLEQYHKIASGMGLTVHQLFERLDEDSPVDLHSSDVPSAPIVIPDSGMFLKVMENMSAADYDMVIDAYNRTYNKMKEKGLI
ncbi:MAG: helix-turn-helix transcriptional regulator [Clostridia bacterium]|nr:helix-turn-helix transcriptional regulator [Clostridia bacterium]